MRPGPVEGGAPLDLAFGLEHKVAVVTGGASGIGREIALTFGVKGAQVAVLDIQADRAAEVAEASGRGSRGYYCDVSEAVSVAGAIDEVVRQFGRVDILVNCAGRFAYPQEIAAVALFLASDAAAMINGADIMVDGGYAAR